MLKIKYVMRLLYVIVVNTQPSNTLTVYTIDLSVDLQAVSEVVLIIK